MTRSPLIGYALSALSGALVLWLLLSLWPGAPTSDEVADLSEGLTAVTAERDGLARRALADSARHAAEVAALQAVASDFMSLAAGAEAETRAHAQEAARADAARARAERHAADAERAVAALPAAAPDSLRAAALTVAVAACTDARRSCAASLAARDSVIASQDRQISAVLRASAAKDSTVTLLAARVTDVTEGLEASIAATAAARTRADLWQTEARHQSRAAARWKTAAKVGTAVAFVGGALLTLVATQ